MTVADLIEELSKFNPRAVVSVSGYENGITDSFRVYQSRVTLNVSDQWYEGEHSEDRKGKGVRVIIDRGPRGKIWSQQ